MIFKNSFDNYEKLFVYHLYFNYKFITFLAKYSIYSSFLNFIRVIAKLKMNFLKFSIYHIISY
jgi:hypothetical protein